MILWCVKHEAWPGHFLSCRWWSTPQWYHAKFDELCTCTHTMSDHSLSRKFKRASTSKVSSGDDNDRLTFMVICQCTHWKFFCALWFRWCVTKGASIFTTPAKFTNDLGSMRGLMAEKDFQPGDTVLSIPEEMLISTKSAAESDLVGWGSKLKLLLCNEDTSQFRKL